MDTEKKDVCSRSRRLALRLVPRIRQQAMGIRYEWPARRREGSINDVPIRGSDRKFHWLAGPRPADHGGLTELGL
jgi:hypothetical protein